MPIHPKQLYTAQGGLCFYCGNEMDAFSFDAHMNRHGWTRDHFVPKSGLADKQKKNIKYNLVLSHHDCNLRKSNTWPTKAMVMKFISLYKKIV